MEVVDEYVRDVIVAGAQAADEALHELEGADVVVARVDKTGLIGNVVCQVFVLFDADDVALFLLDGFGDELHEAFGFSRPLQAHHDLDHICVTLLTICFIGIKEKMASCSLLQLTIFQPRVQRVKSKLIKSL